jgi:hypothetical protein
MRLSANTGICEYLRGGEDEAEREHWYLRVSERGGTRGPALGVGHLKAFSPTARTPIAYAVWRKMHSFDFGYHRLGIHR